MTVVDLQYPDRRRFVAGIAWTSFRASNQSVLSATLDESKTGVP